MASFLGKINRLRNHRLHMANEWLFPSFSMYHEIVQGIPWSGGISFNNPRKLQIKADRFLGVVMKYRPEYVNFPWCPSDVEECYIHPAMWTSERMQQLVDKNPEMTALHAFRIADKEMSLKKADVDLQVTLAREHAARLGVANQGVAGMAKRAHKVYESVFQMKAEEAIKNRRKDLMETCEECVFTGERLSMLQLQTAMPYEDEQLQFFKDFPQFRQLFPPLWWKVEEVLETAKSGFVGSKDTVKDPDEKDFMEEGGRSQAVRQWPPQAIVNMVKANIMDTEARIHQLKDSELERAQKEMTETQEMHSARAALQLKGDTNVGGMTEAERTAHALQNMKLRERRAQTLRADKRWVAGSTGAAGATAATGISGGTHLEITGTSSTEKDGDEGMRSKFFDSYRAFIEKHHLRQLKDRPTGFEFKELDVGGSQRRFSSTPSHSVGQDILQQALKSHEGKEFDAEDIEALRRQVEQKYGDAGIDALFARPEGGGAFSFAELEGYGEVPVEASISLHLENPRHVNLASDVSMFYPENAYPPHGLTAIPISDTDLRANRIHEKHKAQLAQLKQWGKKYAHDIEDFAPIKSKEYLQESLEWGKPIYVEPDISVASVATVKTISAQDEKEMEALGETVFENETERKEYEAMLDKRHDYIIAKRKERDSEWSQYWPSDKPESLIYRGPEVIRERFPEAYKLAVTRSFEKMEDMPLNQALASYSYRGLWKTVRKTENRNDIRDLGESEWQHKITLDPSHYKK